MHTVPKGLPRRVINSLLQLLVSQTKKVKVLTRDRSCIVWGVSPQVLRGLRGRLRETLRAPRVTHTEKQTNT